MSFKYMVDGEVVELHPRTDKVAVRYREPAPHSHRAAVAATVRGDFQRRFEIPGEKYTVLPAMLDGDAPSVAVEAAAALPPSAGLARAAQVFRHGDTDLVATDRVLVGLVAESAPIDPLLANVRKVGVKARGYGEYVVRLAEDVDPLEIANALAANPAVRYAEPDFVHIGPHVDRPRPGRVVIRRNAATADAAPAAGGLDVAERQYAMRTTHAIDAWSVVQARPDVSIAILDEGVDTRHKDLQPHVLGGYDAIDGDEYQEPNPWDGHGTACAGLAAALPVGATGARGVAGGCSLLAVRIAQSPFPAGPWVWSTDNVADAVDWSWREGADVLSNSWRSAPSNRIASAIRRALSLGRGNKGCVVVVAAGNDSGPVSFPGTLGGVLTVSACNESDEFKTTSSSDGETWWGSNRGPQIGVAAPGVHNFTTDISAEGGYDGADYYAQFNGTSSATPLVAGAAALVLCARSDLTGAEAIELICANADQVGTEPYIDGRNDQFGRGRLNVLKAVRAAFA